MGNEASCSCLSKTDEYDMITRDDCYKFKRSVKFFILYFLLYSFYLLVEGIKCIMVKMRIMIILKEEFKIKLV